MFGNIYKADAGRYSEMKYNHCGKSGLKLPEVSLGLWHNFGDTASYENMTSCVLQLLIMESPSLTLPTNTGRSLEQQKSISEGS